MIIFKMKNSLYILISIVCVFLSVPSFSKTLKIATTAPDGTFWMKEMRAGAKQVKKLTQSSSLSISGDELITIRLLRDSIPNAYIPAQNSKISLIIHL